MPVNKHQSKESDKNLKSTKIFNNNIQQFLTSSTNLLLIWVERTSLNKKNVKRPKHDMTIFLCHFWPQTINILVQQNWFVQHTKGEYLHLSKTAKPVKLKLCTLVSDQVTTNNPKYTRFLTILVAVQCTLIMFQLPVPASQM